MSFQTFHPRHHLLIRLVWHHLAGLLWLCLVGWMLQAADLALHTHRGRLRLVIKVAVRSLTSLCLMVGKPPLAHEMLHTEVLATITGGWHVVWYPAISEGKCIVKGGLMQCKATL